MRNPAGFWDRFFASFIDGIITAISFGIITYLVHGELNPRGFNVTDLLNILYFVILPVIWSGYTVGKKSLGIRIVKKSGEDVGIFNMLLRYVIGGLVYLFTFGIGLIVSIFMVAIREDKRAIHDFIGGTKVMKAQG
ncbi:RDD family protein [Halobacillus salinus]|uniref:RDD family protein n=1 Tax=Halobacillus salinus TaxID=192814 RepID=A0A4Z0H0B9_9BACI|nr:RDD family protein [Halobacillus salinus]TGB02933.1 RDD family protein [Halobacillus salinus]